MKGYVTLVGAGPGDPGLITLKGKECLEQADVVIYDALLNPHILNWAPAKALKIYVGKRDKHHAREQRDINALLVRHASRGKKVVRLKGGDPFIFGRGGEEALYLYEHHIPFEIVPGVSSALGASAYAGIPLTDRDLGSMVTWVTGHESKEAKEPSVEWSRISRKSTLVVFMGRYQVQLIMDRLLKHNWRADTPAAVIYWGTTAQQQVIEGTIETIVEETDKAKIESPVLIIVGHVVSLRKKLRWFEKKPLFGKTILITRSNEQAPVFASLLQKEGANVISCPTIEFAPPKSWKPVDDAIQHLSQFHWILFTSTNGVIAFFERLQTHSMDLRALQGLRIGAIGPKTAAELQKRGLLVDVLPEEYRAEALADVMGKVKGQAILLARAEEAREILPQTLTARGATVTIVPVYRTNPCRRIPAVIREQLLKELIDVVTFTSSSTVNGFMKHFSPIQRKRIFKKTKAAVIGPITEETLKAFGVQASFRAPLYTTESLTQAILRGLSQPP